MSGFVIGGETAWKVRAHKDIGLAWHWVNSEPSLVVYPLHRHLRLNKAIPFVLPIDCAHEVVRPGTKGEGVDSAALLEKASTAAMVMGLGNDWQAIRSVADAILSGIDELLDMPPEPDWHEKRQKAKPVGELALKVDGKTVIETEA